MHDKIADAVFNNFLDCSSKGIKIVRFLFYSKNCLLTQVIAAALLTLPNVAKENNL